MAPTQQLGQTEVNLLDKQPLEWQNTPTHGGVGAPVGLTVFKTAGGSLGAAPDRFDSYTPLPELMYIGCEQVSL